MSHEDWLDLGSPETVTVTVRPDDLLNEGHPFVAARGSVWVDVPWCATCGQHRSQH